MSLIGRMVRTCTLIGIAVALSGAARADLVAIYQSAIDNLNGTWTYNYNIDLTTDSTLKGPADPAASFITLLDVHHYVAGSVAIVASYTAGGAADWHLHETLLGDLGFVQAPPDDPSVVNLIAHYDAAADWVAGAGGTIPVLQISFLATGGPEIVPSHIYTAQNHVTSIGNLHGNSGPYIGPQAPVPEPGVLSLLLGSGVGGSLLALRRRIRK